MTKSEVKNHQYRKCTRCPNVYIEEEINRLLQLFHDYNGNIGKVYCLRCHAELSKKDEISNKQTVTKLFERDLSEKKKREWAETFSGNLQAGR